jgi:hypothetical protein
VHCRVGAHDVIVGEDVGEPERFDALRVRTHDRGVSTELGLREHNSDAHSAFNHAAPQLLPARRNPQTARVFVRAVGAPLRPRLDHGHGYPGGAGAGAPGDQAETPFWIPRSISSFRAGLPAGVVSRQPQLRVLNAFWSTPVEFVSALASAAPSITAPTAIAMLTSTLVITRRRFTVDITNSPFRLRGPR